MYSLWAGAPMRDYRAAFSGDVMQDILQGWFSPSYTVQIAGDPQIETEIVRDVASYGDQIGRLIDAVLVLARKTDAGDADEIKDLETLAKDVDAVVDRHKGRAEKRAEQALERLNAQDPAAARRLAARFSG